MKLGNLYDFFFFWNKLCQLGKKGNLLYGEIVINALISRIRRELKLLERKIV